jgi:opacity protein-like surface antigen
VIRRCRAQGRGIATALRRFCVVVTSLAVLGFGAVVAPCPSDADEPPRDEVLVDEWVPAEDSPPEPPIEERPTDGWRSYTQKGRFYLYFQGGNAFLLDTTIGDELDLVEPGGANFLFGGGVGYNITDHWGIDFQAAGTEPNIQLDGRGTVRELSNITLIPNIRFRYPLLDGRLVPYLSAGVGASLYEVNDTKDQNVKLEMDTRSVVGMVAAGLEYFAAPNVSLGIALQYNIYPGVELRYRETNGLRRSGVESVNMDSLGLVGQVRMFFGETEAQATAEGGRRRRVFSRRGPFDTDAKRFYLYGLGGPMFFFDNAFALDVNLQFPGGINWLVGGGVGLNLSRHWGLDVQLVHTEPTLDGNPTTRAQPGGKLAEMGNFTVLPGVRYRHAFFGGRLVPFISGHVGAAFNHINDQRHKGMVEVSVDESSVAGAVIIGAEYFVNSNITLGLSVPFYIYPDWASSVVRRNSSGGIAGSDRSTMNYTGAGILIQLKAYIP